MHGDDDNNNKDKDDDKLFCPSTLQRNNPVPEFSGKKNIYKIFTKCTLKDSVFLDVCFIFRHRIKSFTTVLIFMFCIGHPGIATIDIFTRMKL